MGLNSLTMRKAILLSFLVLTGILCKAQTFEEWFKQKETQKKYLVQQIAALKIYLGYVQKGYAIAKNGLTAIGRIKSEDNNLHDVFFRSLVSVNPRISNTERITDIVSLQLKTLQVYKDVSRQIHSNKQLNADEVNIVIKVFEKLLTESNAIISDLTIVITPGKLGMKDDERLRRIEKLYTDMQERYAFAQNFGTEAKLFSLQRTKEYVDIHASRMLGGF